MNLDDMLGAAASAIAAMPETDFAVGLGELEAEHRRRLRDDVTGARHAAFLDSFDLEQAAYDLGRRNDEEGNLGEAVRWYRIAARHDHADAALRLGEALDLLADRCARRSGENGYNAQRGELHLITEAAQAYAEAYAAGYPEAADRIDEMLAAFTRRQQPAQEPSRPERPRPCSYVRDFAPGNGVLREDEIQELSSHAAQCISCMEEFVSLIKAAAGAMPTGNVTDPFAVDAAAR